MVAKIRSHGTSSRSAAGKIYPALPKLRDQLQSRGRHGAPLHRETKRRRSRETVERICQTPFLATASQQSLTTDYTDSRTAIALPTTNRHEWTLIYRVRVN